MSLGTKRFVSDPGSECESFCLLNFIHKKNRCIWMQRSNFDAWNSYTCCDFNFKTVSFLLSSACAYNLQTISKKSNFHHSQETILFCEIIDFDCDFGCESTTITQLFTLHFCKSAAKGQVFSFKVYVRSLNVYFLSFLFNLSH